MRKRLDDGVKMGFKSTPSDRRGDSRKVESPEAPCGCVTVVAQRLGIATQHNTTQQHNKDSTAQRSTAQQ